MNSSILTFVKKNWFGLVSMAFSVVILAFFLFSAGGVSALAESIAGMSLFWLAAAVFCTLLYWLTDCIILHCYVRMKYKEHHFLRSFRTVLIGLMYNCLTPFASGGQPMQVYDMTKSGIDAGDAVSYVTVKAMVYQIGMTVYAVAAAILTFGFFNELIPAFPWLLALGMFVNAVFLGALFTIALSKKTATRISLLFVKILCKLRIVKQRERVTETVLNQINVCNDSFKIMYGRKGELIFTFVMTMIQLGLYYSLPYLIFRGFNLSGQAFWLMFGAQSVLMLITSFVPMPGSSGAAETGFYLFFATFFTQGVIMPAVFIWRVLTYYACILAGAGASLWALILNRSKTARRVKI